MIPAQVAWLHFVDQVERGEKIDKSGQYVAKGTKVAIDASGQRTRRLKFDAATNSFSHRYSINTNEAKASAAGGGETNIIYCPECGGSTGEGGPRVTSTFTSSVGQGGSGYIHDLKLVTGASGSNSTSQQVVLGTPGLYTLLNADLNKGAGGNYIYLCFQRNLANVLSGLEYYQGQPYAAPADFLTNFQTKNGSLSSKPAANRYFFDIWIPNQNPYYDWGTLDLNAGAGGEHIYSFQSKTPFVRQQSGGTVARPAFSEVGILSGNSASIQPPAEWSKYPNDLNEGAGGDFIYFCYKY